MPSGSMHTGRRNGREAEPKGPHFREKWSPKAGQLNPAKNSPKEVTGGKTARGAGKRAGLTSILYHIRAQMSIANLVFLKIFFDRAHIPDLTSPNAKMQDASCNPAFFHLLHSLRSMSGLRFTHSKKISFSICVSSKPQ